MKTKLVKLACFTFVAAALAAAPAISRADDALSTNAPSAHAPGAKKKKGMMFHGSVSAVDAAAMTFTVGNNTYAIGSNTKISNEGKPGVFADLTVGEMVSGSYKKDTEGKMTANAVKIGVAKKKRKGTTDGAAPEASPAGK
jgi:hypothetical protein